jgi:hypothetical protein
MVNPQTGLNGRKGELLLRPAGLTFRPALARFGETVFPLSDIKRARRLKGTPVLEVALSAGFDFRLVGFYFIKPPSMEAEGYRFLERRRVRKTALNELRGANAGKKNEIQHWVNAIEEAIGTGRAAR